jgi:hypothetical protein
MGRIHRFLAHGELATTEFQSNGAHVIFLR